MRSFADGSHFVYREEVGRHIGIVDLDVHEKEADRRKEILINSDTQLGDVRAAKVPVACGYLPC